MPRYTLGPNSVEHMGQRRTRLPDLAMRGADYERNKKILAAGIDNVKPILSIPHVVDAYGCRQG